MTPAVPKLDAQRLESLNQQPPVPLSAPLTDKLARSRAVLAAVLADFAPARIAVAYTGGKDSGVALFLYREALSRAGIAPLRAISIDTGCKFPQVMEFRDRLSKDWGVALTIARPEVDLATYPVAQDKVACCRDLKIAPLCAALRDTDTTALLTGIRRDEHPSRANRQYAELRAAVGGEGGGCPEHWQVNPILDWTELDIWAFITGENLPYCELYHEGFRSLGCVPCTKPTGPAGADSDERAGRDPDKERQLEILKGLGYF